MTAGTVVVNASGWTDVTPNSDNGQGSSFNGTCRIIYVSQSTGFDTEGTGANQGNGSAAHPYKTIANGASKMRDGSPDWLLLKKGDTWLEVIAGETSLNLHTNGVSAQEPQVIASYSPTGIDASHPRGTGTGARPLILNVYGISTTVFTFPAGSGHYYNQGNYTAFIGLEFYAPERDRSNTSSVSPFYNATNAAHDVTAISHGLHFDWWLVEDCKFSFMTAGLLLSGFGGIPINGIANNGSGLIRLTLPTTGMPLSGHIDLTNGTVARVTTVSSAPEANGLWVLSNVTSTTVDLTGSTFVNSNSGTDGKIYPDGSYDFSSNLILRRNVFYNCYCFSGNSGAAVHYNSINSVAFVENLFHHCGYDQVNSDGNSTVHNIYISAYDIEYDPQTVCDPITMTGNIVAYDASASQLRAGANLSNNLWVKNPSGPAIGFPKAGNSIIDGDVYTEAMASPNGKNNSEDGVLSGSPYSLQYDVGTGKIQRSIFANSTGAFNGTAFVNHMLDWDFNNNVIYKWPSVGVGIDNNKITALSIQSAGSGGGAYPSFTASIDGTTMTVTSITGTPLRRWQQITGTGVPNNTFITALGTGTGGTGTYSIAVYPASNNGLKLSSRTLSISRYHAQLKYNTSGAGTGAYAWISVSGGAVSSVDLEVRESQAYSTSDASPGHDYTVGDILTVNSTSDIAGVTGFTCRVDGIHTCDVITGNRIDVPGSNPGAFYDPTRTVSKYATTIGLADADAFLSQALLQSRDNWDTRLMAASVNTYIRAGFGVSIGTTSGGRGLGRF